jgi:hypothetical protein
MFYQDRDEDWLTGEEVVEVVDLLCESCGGEAHSECSCDDLLHDWACESIPCGECDGTGFIHYLVPL